MWDSKNHYIINLVRLEKWTYLGLLCFNIALFAVLGHRLSDCATEVSKDLSLANCQYEYTSWIVAVFLIDCLVFMLLILGFLALKLKFIQPITSHQSLEYSRLQKILMSVPIFSYISFVWLYLSLMKQVQITADFLKTAFLLSFSLLLYYIVISLTIEPKLSKIKT
jgi:hypothetical protein